jgi:molecular chaperone GrpE
MSDKPSSEAGAACLPEAQPEILPVQADYLSELETAVAQSSALQEKLLRTAADFDNFRKRAAREKEDAVKYAAESFIEAMLPALDSFDLGLASARSNPAAAPIVQGMEMALGQLMNGLRSQGVEVVDATGQIFDPHQHEAVSHQETKEMPEGTVMQQLRRGFKLNGRLLRPSTVVVAKAPSN